jgi:transcriptional regulator with XRE-family HTH domain
MHFYTWLMKAFDSSLLLPDYAHAFGLRLQALRFANNLSQEQVAQMAGISTFSYRKLEHGVSNPGTPGNPRLSTLLALALVFKVDIKDILPEFPIQQ